MRRLPATLLAVLLITPTLPLGSSRADDSATQQAAQEIADARQKANAAADAYFAAESRIDQLAVKQQQLQADIKSLQAEVDALAARVRNVAISRYTSSGTDSLPILTGFKSPQDQVQIDTLIDVVNSSSADDFDAYDAVKNDLHDKQAALADNQRKAEQEKANLDTLRKAANDEVGRLKQVEAQRLKDDAVRQALAAEEAARARKAVQEAKESAPVVTNAPNDPGGSDGGGDGIANTGPASGGASGGQTGGGGAGGRPGGLGGIDYGSPTWMCPTGDAPVAFADTWGAPRSGGRRHQGVDMIGARGTPIVAVVDGFAKATQNVLGGNTIWLTGADGNSYYFAHLDSYGTLGEVTAGTVIGFMGQSGNAIFSVVHLHFEVHPGGGPAVNPYPTVRAHC